MTRSNPRISAGIALALTIGAIGAPNASARPKLDPIQPVSRQGVLPVGTDAASPVPPVFSRGFGTVSVSPNVQPAFSARHRGGSDWSEVGIAAGGVAALTMIGIGGTLLARTRRNRPIGHRYPSAAKVARS